ncbi:tetratricopeptide repeat protein [Treponema sp. OMZ 840]|uniref:tetratricopeptide repeat protein n=1 Tax=Treponema sp. OMZ 840 TaxID=244313 RepID=UPI003D8EF5C0
MKKSLFFCVCALYTVCAALYPQADLSIPGSQKTAEAHPLDMLIAARPERPLVSDIQALLTDNAVVLSWKIEPIIAAGIKELLVYRNVKRIDFVDTDVSSEKNQDEKSARIIAVLAPESLSYTDTDIQRGICYYYAVIARENNGVLYNLIIPSVNASLNGIEFPITVKTQGSSAVNQNNAENREKSSAGTSDIVRKQALPEIQIGRTEYKLQPKKTTDAAAPHKDIPYKNKTGSAALLPEETEAGKSTGDDYSLFAIVDAYINTKDWHKAEKELRQFLQINRTETASARAYFYLGQSLYFTGNYREALRCFQRSCALYPVPSKRWITEVLDAYRID